MLLLGSFKIYPKTISPKSKLLISFHAASTFWPSSKDQYYLYDNFSSTAIFIGQFLWDSNWHIHTLVVKRIKIRHEVREIITMESPHLYFKNKIKTWKIYFRHTRHLSQDLFLGGCKRIQKDIKPKTKRKCHSEDRKPKRKRKCHGFFLKIRFLTW